MHRRLRWIALVAVGLLALPVLSLAFGWLRPPAPRADAPMRQAVYLWQRAWTTPVRSSVREIAPAFDGGLVALAYEVGWSNGSAREVFVALDHRLLAASGKPVGLALRIGTCSRERMRDPATVAMLRSAARRIVDDARGAGLEPAELQIDFDSATAQLDDYRRWIEDIVQEVKPTPVTITALPSWMSSGAFGPLVRATDGFVLQVHWAQRFRFEDDAPDLCDTAKAVRWVEQAARHGVPFFVALPTYGHIALFDGDGELRTLVAEQPPPEVGAVTPMREFSANAPALAELMRVWLRQRPAAMQGVVWFRLPVETDRLNWSWPTLARVMRGETPAPGLELRWEGDGEGLQQLVAENTGDLDAELPRRIDGAWPADAEFVGADAMQGMDWSRDGACGVAFRRTAELAAARLRPGERRTLGWVRLDRVTEIGFREGALVCGATD
ncbi:MAG: DUF3142 domain-containing protein [Planctomycetota bacterium]